MKLFDDEGNGSPQSRPVARRGNARKYLHTEKEATALEKLRNLDEKIAGAIEKLKVLKEEKTTLQERVRELEKALSEKDELISMLSSEKSTIKTQIEDLLDELESIGDE